MTRDELSDVLLLLVAQWKLQADYLCHPDHEGDAPTEGDYGCARGLYSAADSLISVLAAIPSEAAP